MIHDRFKFLTIRECVDKGFEGFHEDYDCDGWSDCDWHMALIEFDAAGNFIRSVESDRGEAEDMYFRRDLKWIVDEMNKLEDERRELNRRLGA